MKSKFLNIPKDVFVKLKKLFTEHPQDVGESYLMHAAWAIIFSLHLLFAGVVCFIHAIFPFLFENTASSIAEWILDVSSNRREYE